jgi:hypothetical protein
MKPLLDVDLSRYDNQYIETFLNGYAGLVDDAGEMANEWPDMEDQERQLQRSALIPTWEKRTLLGLLYQASRLTPAQVERLQMLDQQLLEHAASVELAYGPTLGELLHYLFSVGTPLADQSGTLRIETTLSALAQLAETANLKSS